MERLVSFIGIFVLIAIAYSLSTHKGKVRWQTVGMGILLQVTMGLLVLGVPVLGIPGLLSGLFVWANDAFMAVLAFTDAGSDFVLGPLIDPGKSNELSFSPL